VSEGESNVREAIQIILRTEPRERIRLPEFGGGLDAFLFEPIPSPPASSSATGSSRRWRAGSRASPSKRSARARAGGSARLTPGETHVADPQTAIATITYRLIATQTRERVTAAVTLGR